MHAQIRTGIHYKRIGHLMNASCHVGERLLKTKAKGISSTAQKRGAKKITYQTGLRLEDRSLLDKFAQKTINTKESNMISEPEHDIFTRKQSHFQFSGDDDVYGATNRKWESVEIRILNQDTFQSNFGLPSKLKRKNKGTFVYSTKSS
jgi:hypothetical protein